MVEAASIRMLADKQHDALGDGDEGESYGNEKTELKLASLVAIGSFEGRENVIFGDDSHLGVYGGFRDSPNVV